MVNNDNDLVCPCWKCRRERFWKGFKRFFNICAHIRRWHCRNNRHTWEKGWRFWHVCLKCWHLEESGEKAVTAEDHIKAAAERLAFQERYYVLTTLYQAPITDEKGETLVESETND